LDALLGVDEVVRVGGGVGESLFGLEVDCVFLLVEERSSGFPEGLIAEKHVLVIHFDSSEEDGVLHR
jgi:hypothetical protein